IGSVLKVRSQAALSRVSTTRYKWLPDDPSAFELIKPWKWPCFTRLDDSPNQSPPTNSAEEAFIRSPRLHATSPVLSAVRAGGTRLPDRPARRAPSDRSDAPRG